MCSLGAPNHFSRFKFLNPDIGRHTNLIKIAFEIWRTWGRWEGDEEQEREGKDEREC